MINYIACVIITLYSVSENLIFELELQHKLYISLHRTKQQMLQKLSGKSKLQNPLYD